jgi:hypothetical protein
MNTLEQPFRRPLPRQGTLALLAAALLLCGAAARAQSDGANPSDDRMRPQHCSVATLKGRYGFAVQGSTDAASGLPPALQGPFAAVGTTEYDAAGQVTIAARSASFNGIARQVPAETGRYSVDGNCVVTAQYPSGVTTRNVLIDGGRAMFAMQTNPGTTIGGLSQRTARADDVDGRRRRCTLDDLAGRYGFLAEGVAGPPTLPLTAAAPLVGNGVVQLQRDGSFSATALRSVGGMQDAQPLALAGRFSVDADCAVSMHFDAGFNFVGTVVDGGREILFVETDPGTSLTVKARRQ